MQGMYDFNHYHVRATTFNYAFKKKNSVAVEEEDLIGRECTSVCVRAWGETKATMRLRPIAAKALL